MFMDLPPPTPGDCRVRTELDRDLGVLGRLRATVGGGFGQQLEGKARGALTAGLGIDLLRIERACRKGTGFFPDEPILRTSFGPWIDATLWRAEPTSYRGALQVSFGKIDRSLVPLPMWEVFTIVGLARTDRTSASFSLGGRFLVLQGEARLDVAPNHEATLFMLFGVHADLGAYL